MHLTDCTEAVPCSLLHVTACSYVLCADHRACHWCVGAVFCALPAEAVVQWALQQSICHSSATGTTTAAALALWEQQHTF
jgi:hypothetical protein